ncbi:MAG: FHA domain-containing protein [Planctomycetes bacterium]|nr:FHA domain-containing protein [Planctomycetota bacterium]
MPKLVIIEGEAVREFILKSGDTLGRASMNAVALEGNGISRVHCKFSEEKGAWFVEDQGSSNGTLVNKRRVSKFELADGDELTIGGHKLRFLEGGDEAPVVEAAGWGEDDLSIEEKHFLVLAIEGRLNEVVPLPEGRLTVGRNARHALVLKRSSVSGDHAEIVRRGSEVLLRDLGSSNGTSVDGAKVAEASLVPGAKVRFGDALCIYGKGDAADFFVQAAEEPASAAVESTDQTETGHWNDDAAFTVSQAPAGSSDKLWTVLSLVAVLAVAAGGGWFFFSYERTTDVDGPRGTRRASNLLPEAAASFESGMDTDPPLWAKIDAEEPGDVEVLQQAGGHVLSVGRAADQGVTLVGCGKLLPVTGGSAWLLSVRTTGDARAVLGVRYGIESKEQRGTMGVVFARDLLTGHGRASDGELEGRVVIPEGANLAQIVVGVMGSGTVRFDDVAVESWPVTEAGVKSGDFVARQAPSGVLRLSRLGARVLDMVDVVRPAGKQWIQTDDTAQPLKTTLTSADSGLQWSVDAEALAADQAGLGLLLPGGDVQVVLTDGEKGRLVSEACTAVPATAVVIGEGGNRIRVSFDDGSGVALRLPVNFTPDASGGASRIFVAAGGRTKLRMNVALSFESELSAATALRSRAREAARKSEFGQVQLLCAEILERFPFDDDTVREAKSLLAEHTAKGRKLCDDTLARVDDALFFRDWRKATELSESIAAEVQRYAGTAQGQELDALRMRLQQARDGINEPQRRVRADMLLARAKDYLELGRDALAAAFLKSVSERYPGTDAADEAAQLLARLAAKGGR